MVVLALHMAPARDIASQGSGEWWDKEWRTGFHKQPQEGPQWLGYQGFRGDEVADTKHHGGVDKAVCVYPSEHLAYWRSIAGLAEVGLGAFGENISTQGLTEADACIGDVYTIGEALVQVSQPRQPCWKLARRWRVKDLAAQVERNGKTGFYFRVLQHGYVAAGDAMELRERAWPQWSIARSNAILHHGEGGPGAARELSECPALSGSWKDGLWMMSQSTRHRDASARTGQPG